MFDSILEEEERSSSPPRAGILSAWQLPLAVCAALPTIATTFSVKKITAFFQAMAQFGSAGVGVFSVGMYEANQPLVAALGLTALLVVGLGVTQLRAGAHRVNPIPVAVCVLGVAVGIAAPLLQWSAQSFAIKVFTGEVTGRSIAETSTYLSRLLIAAASGGLIGPLIAAPAAIMAIVRPARSGVRAGKLVPIAWLVIAGVFAALAIAFYSRNAMLHEAAMTGKLPPAA